MVNKELVNKKTIAINAIAAGGAKFLNVFIILWAQHKLLKNLSSEEFSIYPLAAGFLFFLPFVSTLFTSPVQRYCAAAYAKGEKKEITSIVSTVFPYLAAFCLVFLGLGLLAAFNIDKVFRIQIENADKAKWMFGIIVVANSISIFFKPFGVAFFVRQKLAALNVIRLLGELSRLALLLSFFFCFSYQVIWLIVADGLVSTMLAIGLAVASRKLIPELRFQRAAIDRSKIKKLFSFGISDIGINFARMLRSVTPIFLLNRFSTPVDVNGYHIGQSAYRQSQKFWSSLRVTMGPPMIAMYANNQTSLMRHTYYRAARLAMWAILFVCTPLFIFGSEVIGFYGGSQYQGSAGIMVALLLRYPFQMLNALLPQLARAAEKPNQVAIPMILGEVACALSIYVSIVHFDGNALSAAISCLCVSVLMETCVLVPIANRILQGSYASLFFRSFVPGVLPAIVTVGVGMLVRPEKVETVWTLAAWIAPVVLFYVAMVFVFFGAEDKRDMKSFISKFASLFGKLSRSRGQNSNPNQSSGNES